MNLYGLVTSMASDPIHSTGCPPNRLQLDFFELGIGRSRCASHRGPPPGPGGGPGTPNPVELQRLSTFTPPRPIDPYRPLKGPAGDRPKIAKPYEFIGSGAMDVTKPYEFIWFGYIHGLKPYT